MFAFSDRILMISTTRIKSFLFILLSLSNSAGGVGKCFRADSLSGRLYPRGFGYENQLDRGPSSGTNDDKLLRNAIYITSQQNS